MNIHTKVNRGKMKKLLLVSTLAAAAAFSNTAFAQAKNFEGFTAGVNVSSVGGTSTISGDGAKFDYGQQSFVPGVELGYNFAASKDVVLGLTATYDFADSKLGQESFDNFGSGTIKGQNRYSINFKPGFVVTPSTMIYATVGYNSMTAKVTALDQSKSGTVSGVGYGAGISVMVNTNIFVKAEFQQVNFNSINLGGPSITPNLTVGTIGIGYKF